MRSKNLWIYALLIGLGLVLILGKGNGKFQVGVDHNVNFRQLPVGTNTWVQGPLGGRWQVQRQIQWQQQPYYPYYPVDVRAPGTRVQVNPYYNN